MRSPILLIAMLFALILVEWPPDGALRSAMAVEGRMLFPRHEPDVITGQPVHQHRVHRVLWADKRE